MYRKQRNKCVKTRKKCIQEHSESITRHGIIIILNNADINVVKSTTGRKPLSVLDKVNVTFLTEINTILEE